MSKRYVVDTTTLMSYFSTTFGIKSAISPEGLKILDDAFQNNTNILLIPSIVFIEIFSKQFVSPEIAARIRYDVFEKIKSRTNISIESIDQEVLECFIQIKDIEPGHNFDNHDKIIFATAMKYQEPLITSDQRLKRYNRKQRMIPRIID